MYIYKKIQLKYDTGTKCVLPLCARTELGTAMYGRDIKNKAQAHHFS